MRSLSLSRSIKALLTLVALIAATSAEALVITEIHYHPKGAGDLARRNEFIEIYNEDADPRDVTEFSLTNGVSFTLQERTILDGHEYLVICADEDLIQALHGITNTVGNWSSVQSLDNGGERVTLSNPGGGIVSTVEFNDRGRWSSGADGTGHSLSLIDPYREIDDPDNWALSIESGGTPGEPNFPDGYTPPSVVFNEGLVNTAGVRWVELYNRSDAAVDLSGLYLSDDRENPAKAQIAANTVIQPGEWLTFEDSAMGLDFSLSPPMVDRIYVSLYDQPGDRVLDASTFSPDTTNPAVFGLSQARIPDGGVNVEPAADPTLGGANAQTVEDDVVISEINYHPIKEDPELEFVELCNRGTTEINLGGWAFDRGINFNIPDNTTLSPGEYLVVARNPTRFAQVYGPGPRVIGPSQDAMARELFGVLRNTGERIRLLDERGNTADTVSYRDGGEWSRWADGRGGTLELIDLWQDNSNPQAWDSSDDSGRAQVVSFEYTAKQNDAFADPDGHFFEGTSEIQLLNLDRGIVVIDDLEIPGEASSETIVDGVVIPLAHTWEYFKGESDPPANWHQLPEGEGVGPFVRGDCNNNGVVAGDIGDPLFLLFFSFAGGPAPFCMAACDADGNGQAGGDTSDALFLLTMNYLAGPTPPAPFPTCDRSNAADDLALGCEVPTTCLEGGFLTGPSPLGYGEQGLGTDLTDMRNSYLSLFVRTAFELPTPGAGEKFLLEMDYDDGFVAYVNGEEIARDNVNGSPPSISQQANGNREKGDVRVFDLTNRLDRFREGTNLLAIQIHNRRINSTDLWLSPRLLVSHEETLPSGWNMVPNGEFEEDLDEDWMSHGTHFRSGVTRSDPITGTGSLKLIAGGSGDQKVNRVERELAQPLVFGREYTVRLKARWVVGSQNILSQGFGFGLSDGSLELHVPEDLGTPGARNGVARNLGPVIDEVSQNPVFPAANQAVTVRARVYDHPQDGVASATLRYALNRSSNSFSEISMTGPDGDGFYTAIIPGQSSNTIVLFEIVASDGGGRPGRFPLDHTRRTHPLLLDPDNPTPGDFRWATYGHKSRSDSSLHDIQLWMDKDKEAFLYSRPVHSDDYVEATLVFEDRAIYYGCGFRFQGSFLSRGQSQYRVRMPDDNPLHGRIPRFNLDRDGFLVRDRLINYLIRWNNVGGMKAPYTIGTIARGSLNGRFSNSTLEMKEPPGRATLKSWFPDDDGGQLFEMDERSDMSDFTLRSGNRSSARWEYPPYTSFFLTTAEEEQSYRFYFNHRTLKNEDDFSSIIDTARFLDPSKTSDATFNAEVFDRFRVEEFLRVLTVRQNTGDFDTWGCIFGRSAYFYKGSVEDQWRLLPWDSDSSFGGDGRSVTTLLIPTSPTSPYEQSFDELERAYKQPAFRRCHYAIIKEMVDRQFDPDFLDPYIDALVAFGSTETKHARPGGYIDERADLLRDRIASTVFPQKSLEITTNGGLDFNAETNLATLDGDAPVEIRFLRIVRNGVEIPAEESPPGVEFSNTSVFGWALMDIPLVSGANTLEVLGFDRSGAVIDSDTIVVTAP